MDRARPVSGEGAEVLFGGIALVDFKAVVRVAGGQCDHGGIAVFLGKDGGGGDGGDAAVSFDDGLAGDADFRAVAPVDENIVGFPG